MPTVLDDALSTDIPMRVRSNHALEHGTLHDLQEKGISTQMGGISDIGGFWIYGDVPTDMVLAAAQEALNRLSEGEKDLAVHPNCGTNLAVGGLIAGGMAWVGMLGGGGKMSKKLRRLPIAVLLGLVGYELAKPLGPKLQEQITTNADVQNLQILEVIQHRIMDRIVHRVSTRLAR